MTMDKKQAGARPSWETEVEILPIRSVVRFPWDLSS